MPYADPKERTAAAARMQRRYQRAGLKRRGLYLSDDTLELLRQLSTDPVERDRQLIKILSERIDAG